MHTQDKINKEGLKKKKKDLQFSGVRGTAPLFRERM